MALDAAAHEQVSPAERSSPAPWVALATVLVVAMVWVLWVIRFRPWVAHNDFAVMRVSLERMLDGHVPTVGTYSRLGVYHPGPLREWLFVGPYALGGGRASTLPATALVFNLAWVALCGWLALRAGAGACRVAICGGATLLVIGLGPNLASPWNPHLAILPLYAACWAVALLIGRRRSDLGFALAAVAAASFAGQMHASALPAAGLLLGAAVVVPVARRRGGFDRRRLLPLFLGVLLWVGVLLDLRRLGRSNLVDLVQAGSGSTLGLPNASALASRLLWPPTVLTGSSIRPSAEPLIGFSRIWLALLVLALCALAGGSWLLVRRRTRPSDEPLTIAAAASVAVVMIVVAIVSISAFEPPPFRYLFGPLQAVAVFALAVVLSGPLAWVLEQLEDRTTVDRPQARATSIAVAVAVVVWSVMFIVVPVDDHESAARRALGVDAAVERFLDANPSWTAIEVIGLDMTGALLEDEVAVIAYRAGREVRMRQFGLDLPLPRGGEPVLAVAMGQSFACLEATVSETVLSGVIGSDPVGIFALEPAADGLERCDVR